MAILQVYQAKLLKSLDEDGPDPEVFKELRRTTDLALRATKVTARAISHIMGNLVVLYLHLWLTLTELKDSEKTAHLDTPVNPSGLFGAAVEMITEHFVEAQKQSKAISHFLSKRAGVKYPVRSCSFSVQSVGRPQASSAAVRSEHEPAVRSRQPWPKARAVSRRRKAAPSAEGCLLRGARAMVMFVF